MSVTPLGAVLLVLSVAIILRRGRGGYPYALGVCLPFYDSAAVIVLGIGVSSYYCAIIGLLILSLFKPPDVNATVGRSVERCLTAFWIVCLIATLIGPWLFAGTPVYSSDAGLDEQIGREIPLVFTQSHVAQLAYLTVNLLFVLQFKRRLGLGQNVMWIALATGVGVGIANYVALATGYVWPQEWFDNSPNNAFAYTIETARLRGQFAEPSHLGFFSAVALAAFASAAWFPGRSSLRRLLSLMMATLSAVLVYATASGTALAGLALGGTLLGAMIMWRVVVKRANVEPGQVLLFLGFVCVLVLLWPRLEQFGRVVAAGRLTGARSAYARLEVDLHAWDVTTMTYGLGVGLGGNRTSSMVMLLLSSVGVLGLVLFAALAVRSLRKAFGTDRSVPLAVALLVALSAAAISEASFASPLLWSLIAVCANADANRELDRVREHPAMARRNPHPWAVPRGSVETPSVGR